MSLAALLMFVRALGLGLALTLVAGWSAAEAALFVVVADVPISWVALRKGARAGLLAASDVASAGVCDRAPMGGLGRARRGRKRERSDGEA